MAFRFGFDLPSDPPPDGGGSGYGGERPGKIAVAASSGPGTSESPLAAAAAVVSGGKGLTVLDVAGLLSRSPPETGETVRFESVPLGPPPYDLEPLKRIVLQASPTEPVTDCDGVDGVPVSEEERAAKSLIASGDTDLVPGVYEGGLKLWECALDLCKHLAEEICRLNAEDSGNDEPSSRNDCRRALEEGGSTLELGCGHGLPGCLVLREVLKRKSHHGDKLCRSDGGVLFSDYNEFVLCDATLPNVKLNAARSISIDLSSTIGMAAGDWMELSERLRNGTIRNAVSNKADAESVFVWTPPPDGRFDLILAAETAYAPSSTHDTAVLLGRHLKINTGIGLVATKRYYFGVGGGSDALRECAAGEEVVVEGVQCRLEVKTVRAYDNGRGNIRELLRVRCIQRLRNDDEK